MQRIGSGTMRRKGAPHQKKPPETGHLSLEVFLVQAMRIPCEMGKKVILQILSVPCQG